MLLQAITVRALVVVLSATSWAQTTASVRGADERSDHATGSPFLSFCFGDGGSSICPCFNIGAPGHGCDNSSATGGALLSVTGIPSLSADTVQLTSSDERPGALSVVLQGDNTKLPTNFGDGFLCAWGNLKRLYMKHAVGGVVVAPLGAEPSISARSAAMGDLIPPGARRNYQVYYRDPSTTYCTPPLGDTFNISGAIAIEWGS